MTEKNYFCFAKEYNDVGSFQQNRYRVFNVELTKEEYDNIDKINLKLEFDKNESRSTRYKTAFIKAWNNAPQSERDKVLNLKQFNHEAFYEYWGVDTRNNQEEMTLAEVCKLLGKNIKIIK